MSTVAGLQKSITLHFVAIGVGAALILLTCITWLFFRVDAQAFSHVVLLVGAAMFAIIGLVAWVAAKLSRTMRSQLDLAYQDRTQRNDPIGRNQPFSGA